MQISQMDNFICVWTLFANLDHKDTSNKQTLNY